MCCNQPHSNANKEGAASRRAEPPVREKQLSGLKKIRTHILVCEHKDCLKRGGKESLKELKHALRDSGSRERVLITKVDCLDQCDDGPVMVVYPEGVWYGEVDGPCARKIAERHSGGGRDMGEGHAAGCRILRDMSADAGSEEQK